MANFTDIFPNIYVDGSGNTRIDGVNISIGDNSLSITPSDISTTTPVTLNNTLQLENNIFLKNQLVSDGSAIPAGYVGIGFERDLPFFDSPDFETGAKFVDARALVAASTDSQLQVNDEFILLGGTSVDPLIITLPTNPFINSRVYYLGGVGSYFGQLNSGNIDLVLYNVVSGAEVFRGTTLTLDTGTNLTFSYSLISSNPLIEQWSAGISV